MLFTSHSCSYHISPLPKPHSPLPSSLVKASIQPPLEALP